jgi:hypothetical protein
VADLIFSCFFRKPGPPGVDFKWECPLKECTYIIDLLHLSNENREELDDDIVEKLRSKTWSIFDRGPGTVFLDMVDHHYREHLTKLGVKWEGAGKTVSVCLHFLASLTDVGIRQRWSGFTHSGISSSDLLL